VEARVNFMILAVAVALLVPAPARDDELPSGHIKPPRKVKSVPPEYPPEAVKSGLQGIVLLECTIGADGSVVDAKVLRGDAPLTDAAIRAVRKWRYTPVEFNGKATQFVMTITINFGRVKAVSVNGLCQSLSSQHEAVRESAAILLGTARTGGKIRAGDMAEAKRALKALLEREQSERVRKAAQDALAHLESE
jgi:TonB family protein